MLCSQDLLGKKTPPRRAALLTKDFINFNISLEKTSSRGYEAFSGERMKEKRLLQSWKEISDYLNCSVRTCHRWEEELDLPIHRLDGTPKARVFAYTDELDQWRAEKLGHTKSAEKTAVSAPWKKYRRIMFLTGGAIGLVAIAIFVWHLFPPNLLPIPDDKPSLAIVQFENPGGNDSLAPWTTALPDLIITDLLQSRYATVVGITDLYRKLRDLKLAEAEKFSNEDIRKVAQIANVRYVATGSLKKTSRDVTVSVTVHNTKTGESVKSFEAGFRNEEYVFAAADALSEKIKLAIGLNSRYVSRDIDKKVEEISTSSPQAFKLFSQGYRLAGIAKYQEGIPVLQKAAGIDPKFAMAYKYLFLACLNSLRKDDAEKYMRKTVDLAGRLSERERGQAFVLFYEMYEENSGKRLESLERLCRFYPDDWLGSQRLLSIYIRNEEWDKALPVAERSWRVNKTNSNMSWQLLSWLVQCYENLGRIDKAGTFLNAFIQDNPNPFPAGAVNLRVYFLIRRNQFDIALAYVESLIAHRPNDRNLFLLKGEVYFYQNDFESAEREFRRAFDQGELRIRLEALSYLRDLDLARGRVEEAKDQLRRRLEMLNEAERKTGKDQVMPPVYLLGIKNSSRWDLAYLHRLTGKLPEALAEIEAAVQDNEKQTAEGGSGPPLEILHLKALITLEMNRREEFEKQAEKIKQHIEQGQNPRLMRIYYHLLGHRELKNNNLPGSIEYFSKAVDLLSIPGGRVFINCNTTDPQYFYSLAEAYAQYHDSFRALPTFEKVTLPTVERLHSGDLYAKCFYKMAKLYESRQSLPSTTAEDRKTGHIRAIENYRKFLSLWGNADPIFPEIAEAKKRLAALESE